ncbi:MAG: hypothetical protein DRH20_05940 [Deltaproteobacteria bacterium]|nr:MAG: hypothetical protein DRH20_05940 [Deltaproteobacteria bacterium]
MDESPLASGEHCRKESQANLARLRGPHTLRMTVKITGKMKRPRLLIIEEDDQLREMMQLMALRSGYRAETAGSAEEGLPIFMNGTFDLVLVDFGMPGMDGCEFARRIKASSPNIPVCLTTGLEKDDIPGGLSRCSVDALLLKPFTFGEFRRTICKLLT